MRNQLPRLREVRFLYYPQIINLIFNLMATIRETILKVKPGKQKIIPLSEVDVTGYRQQAHVISKELRDKGIVVPDGKPAYTCLLYTSPSPRD